MLRRGGGDVCSALAVRRGGWREWVRVRWGPLECFHGWASCSACLHPGAFMVAAALLPCLRCMVPWASAVLPCALPERLAFMEPTDGNRSSHRPHRLHDTAGSDNCREGTGARRAARAIAKRSERKTWPHFNSSDSDLDHEAKRDGWQKRPSACAVGPVSLRADAQRRRRAPRISLSNPTIAAQGGSLCPVVHGTSGANVYTL